MWSLEGGGAEDGSVVFLGFEAGVGAERVGGVPKAFFQHGAVAGISGWGDPVHISDGSLVQSPS